MSYPVENIAEKIIAKSNPEFGDDVTNLKLQKLLYYMQGFHLAVFNEPLFDDEIEAWMYGPVVPTIYEKYKQFRNSAIELPEETETITLTSDEEDLFEQVYKLYSPFSAYRLMDMTHNEAPWSSVNVGHGNIISKESMREYFLSRIESEQ
jgi:uncharacterized phage-associated protein